MIVDRALTLVNVFCVGAFAYWLRHDASYGDKAFDLFFGVLAIYFAARGIIHWHEES